MSSLEYYKRPLSKDDINALPLRRYSGIIRIVSSVPALHDALEDLQRERVLGFDTETRPTFGKKQPENLPALLQLATERAIYLFQLRRIALPEPLRAVLSDSRIIKTGVAVHDDIRVLQRLAPFEAAGFVDLSDVARQNGLLTMGLRNMAANLLGFRISKTAQCSNWEAPKLSPKQIAYAATDAWVSRELHIRIQDLGLLPHAQ